MQPKRATRHHINSCYNYMLSAWIVKLHYVTLLMLRDFILLYLQCSFSYDIQTDISPFCQHLLLASCSTGTQTGIRVPERLPVEAAITGHPGHRDSIAKTPSVIMVQLAIVWYTIWLSRLCDGPLSLPVSFSFFHPWRRSLLLPSSTPVSSLPPTYLTGKNSECKLQYMCL